MLLEYKEASQSRSMHRKKRDAKRGSPRSFGGEKLPPQDDK